MKNLAFLKEYLTKLVSGGLCVAFSGGVDSALLLKAACEVCDNVHAVTLHTPLHSPAETKLAENFALDMGANFKLIELEKLPDEIMDNPPDRCYLCKKEIFTRICAYAEQNGVSAVLDGTNADDLTEYRPGLRALSELGVKSPLAELKITKAQARSMARELGLAFAEKPSSPCLATRIPYNVRIEPALLEKIDALESYIKTFGIGTVRARICGDTARLEVLPRDFSVIIDARDKITEKAKLLGFSRLTLDLEGFRSGSFDKVKEKQGI